MPDLLDEAAWQQPPRALPGAGAPVLSVDGFEGPLDWLLEMVQARRIDLARLSILALIETFCAAMAAGLADAAGGRGSLARWHDWLVMAATLTQLRARLLLPAAQPEARAARSEAEALRRQLIERARMRAAADWLERRPQLGQQVFARGMPDGGSTATGTTGGDITDLLRACLLALRVPEQQEAAYRLPPPTPWPVADALVRMRRRLASLPEGGPLQLFLPEIEHDAAADLTHRRAAVASTLVASLELARHGELTLQQEDTWLPIQVRQPGGQAAAGAA